MRVHAFPVWLQRLCIQLGCVTILLAKEVVGDHIPFSLSLHPAQFLPLPLSSSHFFLPLPLSLSHTHTPPTLTHGVLCNGWCLITTDIAETVHCEINHDTGVSFWYFSAKCSEFVPADVINKPNAHKYWLDAATDVLIITGLLKI